MPLLLISASQGHFSLALEQQQQAMSPLDETCALICLICCCPGADRSFVTFILDPLYKLTATVIGEHPKTIERVLGEQFGIYLKSSSYSQDVKPLLKEVSRGTEAMKIHCQVS